MQTGQVIFTDAEYSYLAGHPLGRLATIGPDGAPQNHPVALWLTGGAGTIDIGGPVLNSSQKFRNIQADPRVSLVVDDQAETPNATGQTGRGIEIRGQAEIVMLDPPLIAAFSRETLRIHPRRIIAWNIGDPGPVPPGRAWHLQGYRSRNVSQ
jgi:pyridoxamine 5'-phosphate oxidase family protein